MASSQRVQQHLQGSGNASPNSQITMTVSSPYHVPHYYVQSPRESSASTTGAAAHEEAEKWRWSPYSSAPSSPLINFLYHTALGEPLRPANFRRVPPYPHAGPKKAPYKWEALNEESEFPAYDANRKITRKLILFWCRVYLIGLLVLLAIAFLALWFACKPRGSLLAVQKVEFLNVALMHGSDRTQVPTDLLFVRSRVALEFRNPSKYFRMAFHPSILTFSYQGVPIAHGEVLGFHLHQEATHSVEVRMDAQETPLYGAGLAFEASRNHVQALLKVSLDVRVSILWNLLRRPFLQDLNCNFVLNTSTLKVQHLKCN